MVSVVFQMDVEQCCYDYLIQDPVCRGEEGDWWVGGREGGVAKAVKRFLRKALVLITLSPL